MRVTRHAEAIRVQVMQGDAWHLVRLAFLPMPETVEVGPMCCSPTGAGLEVRYARFELVRRSRASCTPEGPEPAVPRQIVWSRSRLRRSSPLACPVLPRRRPAKRSAPRSSNGNRRRGRVERSGRARDLCPHLVSPGEVPPLRRVVDEVHVAEQPESSSIGARFEVGKGKRFRRDGLEEVHLGFFGDVTVRRGCP